MNLSTLSFPSVSRTVSPKRTHGQGGLRLTSKLALVAVAALGFLPGTEQAEAAPITWQTPQAITGVAADVVTTGTLFGAYSLVNTNYTGSPIIALVNGVNFYAAKANSTFSNLTTSGFQGGEPAFGSTTGAYAAIANADYKLLLRTAGYSDIGSLSNPIQMTLSNLTPNTTYLVQMWASDSRAGGARSEAFQSLGGTSSNPLTFQTGVSGGLGQYIVGTFTTGADETTQTIFSTTTSNQVNALQLRVIPEPSTYVMFGLGVGLLLWAKRRRVSQA